MALPPLYETISPDALDDLFADPEAAPGRVLQFPYAGYTIKIESDGQLLVTVSTE